MRTLIAMLTLIWCATAFGDLRVEGAKFRPLHIAVPNAKVALPDAMTNQVAREIVDTVRTDLGLSAVFVVLDPKSYVANLSKEGVARSTIQTQEWTQIGAEALVKMQVVVNGQEVSVDLGIHPLQALKTSGQKTFKGTQTGTKRLAHQISDEILTFFTGEPGIFNSQIAAAKTHSSGKQIVILDFDGSNERVLTPGDGIRILPSFVPEGNAVLYTAYKNNNANLMQVSDDGHEVKTISARSGLNTGAQVSPDRKRIAFTITNGGSSEIYLADRSGNNLKKITDSFGIDISPSFSPDGSKIAFVSSRSGNPHIYLMNSDGSNPKRMTFQGKYNQTPRFSPKGDFIVFTGRDEHKKFDIFLLEVSSGVITRVTQDQGNNEDPWFSPNGRLIVFTSTRDGKRDLWMSSLDGNIQKRVTNGGSYWTPSWGPAR